MDCLDNISSKELVAIASLVSISLSEGKTPDEINVLGNLIVAIGSLMLTIAAQEQSLQSISNNKQ
ncbi:hypothetical protein GCM10008905_10930 [Clostridium malenominatum]|uniref:Holin n=1 Tax=Clostridium malenominatum TaxID=1539 RepID=A0ABP3U2W2_9CLOT